MQRVKIICDRCGNEVKKKTVNRYRLYKYLLVCHDNDEIDLCENCERQLVDWFMKGDTQIDLHH